MRIHPPKNSTRETKKERENSRCWIPQSIFFSRFLAPLSLARDFLPFVVQKKLCSPCMFLLVCVPLAKAFIPQFRKQATHFSGRVPPPRGLGAIVHLSPGQERPAPLEGGRDPHKGESPCFAEKLRKTLRLLFPCCRALWSHKNPWNFPG